MRWQFKASSVFKLLTVSTSVFTMCLAPVAQGKAAESDKVKISQYLKGTGLTDKKKQMTVGEFWRMVRHVYPEVPRAELDEWVRFNRLELMPQVDATPIKGPNGEQVRLTFTKNAQTVSVTYTGDHDRPIKVNGVTLTRKEVNNYNNYGAISEKLLKNDKAIAKAAKSEKRGKRNPVLTWNEYKQLTLKQRAEYMVHMRLAMEAADKVIRVKSETKTAALEYQNKLEFVLHTLFGDAVYASLAGQNCIIAGYISVYGPGQSCGSVRKGGPLNDNLRQQMANRRGNCSGNQVACNPLVYGFQSNGSPYCLAGDLTYATRDCNGLSPIDTAQDKKRIIETYMKAHGANVNLRLNAEGKIPESQRSEVEPFLTELQAMIRDASHRCSVAPLANVRASRAEQDSACIELEKRMFALETFANECGPGQEQGEDGLCLIPDKGGKPTRPKDPNNRCFGMPQIACIAIIGVGVAGLFWYLTKDKSKAKDSEYVPPAPVPEPEPNPNPNPVDPVDPVPSVPCNPPNILVGGVCTSVVVPPTEPPTEGGSTVDTGTGRAGGVR